ncbi:MAG: hypothetical protein KatS3mg111_0733 [Pirellulaceae bacterium]|nr:MAG: hypothetical protein KatS3mg111_0733 [Pirellulaceae bacterium]
MLLRLDKQDDNLFFISVHGRISQTAVEDCAARLPQLIGESNLCKTILLNLRGAEQIDSSGISWILNLDKQIRQAGGKLILHSVPLDIQHVFNLMKLNRVLTLVKNEAEALSLISEENEHHG